MVGGWDTDNNYAFEAEVKEHDKSTNEVNKIMGTPYKRDRDLNSSGEREEEVFKRSRLVIRSPKEEEILKGKSKPKMEELQEIRQLMQGMAEELRKNTEENRKLRTEMREREEQWRNERNQLTERIENLEFKVERMEKEKKRGNVVIKGVTFEEQAKEEAAENFLKDKLNIEIKVKRVINIRNDNGPTTNILEIGDWDKKQEIMKNKHKLKGSQIYIDNDLTAKERAIQMEIRKIAKDRINKGCRVKVGYRKITIEGEEYGWDDKERGVVKLSKEKN